jgi:hypothetical protein
MAQRRSVRVEDVGNQQHLPGLSGAGREGQRKSDERDNEARKAPKAGTEIDHRRILTCDAKNCRKESGVSLLGFLLWHLIADR